MQYYLFTLDGCPACVSLKQRLGTKLNSINVLNVRQLDPSSIQYRMFKSASPQGKVPALYVENGGMAHTKVVGSENIYNVLTLNKR